MLVQPPDGWFFECGVWRVECGVNSGCRAVKIRSFFFYCLCGRRQHPAKLFCVTLNAEKLFLHGDREKWIRYSASNDVHYLCQALDNFIEDVDRQIQRVDHEEYLVYLEDMRSDVLNVLKVYLGVSDDEMETFLALSENRKAARVEEVLFGEE